MNRIESADPDAVTGLIFLALLCGTCALYFLARKFTRHRWPKGHGATYWTNTKRGRE